MSGLLSDVLPFLYSQGDRAKRYMNGLLADPVGTMQQTAGGIVDAGNAQQGLLGQAFGNPQRPFLPTDTNALGQAADNTFQGVMGFAPAGITVYHGSPHVFDKFDSSKIGTGEGAQAYGHGIYTAESPDVAKQYATALSDASKLTPEGRAARALEAAGGDPMEAKRALYREYNESAGTPYGNAAWNAVQALESGKVRAPNFYKVDLPDDAVAKMLDWDKPISEQPKNVQAIVKKLGIKPEGWRGNNYVMGGVDQGYISPVQGGFRAHVYGPGDQGVFPSLEDAQAAVARQVGGARPVTTGASLYERIGDGEDAAQRLRALGVPGIRYLDGTSRNSGAGTSNFVVFPGQESLLQILERNGQPLK
jgi:hypothetical protein